MNRTLILSKKAKDETKIVSLYEVGDQYATWISDVDKPEDTDFGHYFPEAADAIKDYLRRASK